MSKAAFLSILLGAGPLYAQARVDSLHYSALDLAGIEQWSLGAPELVLGGIDGTGPFEFQFVGPIQSLDDGGFALTNWTPPEVRIFNSDGTHRASVGGSGQGPGEFQQLTKLFRLPPDSLATWDISQGRGPVFSADGSYTRQINRPDHHPRSWVHGVFGDGRLAVATMEVGERIGQRRPTTYTLHLASGDGSISNEIGQYPGHLMFLSEELGYWTNITFSPTGAAAIGLARAWITDGTTPRLIGRSRQGLDSRSRPGKPGTELSLGNSSRRSGRAT